MSKRKILFFINSLRSGGAEGVLVNLANNLNQEKYEITLLSLFNVGINRNKLNSNIKYHYIFNRVYPGITYVQKILPRTFLYQTWIKGEYDIVISYLQGITTRVVSGAPKSQKIIAWIHGTFDKKFHSRPYRSINEMLSSYKKMDRVVAVSKDIANSFLCETNNLCPVETIYNVHDVANIKSLAREKLEIFKHPDVITFITVGSLYNVKGHERLLRSLYKLKHEGYRFHLFIIGDGELSKKLTEQVEFDLGMKDEVTFCGYQINPYKYMANADMLLSASYSEGFSGTVSEATIIGIPTLTTMCSGMKEILGENNEYGIVVENSDMGLYQGLKLVLNDPKILYNYKEKVQYRSAFFDTEVTVRQAEKLFDQLLINN